MMLSILSCFCKPSVYLLWRNVYLDLLPIFGLGFYLAALSPAYFSVISFCLTYCVYGLLSAGCRVIVPLDSDVCPLVGEVGPEACVGFLEGVTGTCALVDGAESFFSDGQGNVKWCVMGCLRA